MFKQYSDMLRPWQTMSGWEFDLLRTLPSDEAKRLYDSAFRQATLEMMQTPKWWALSGLVLGLIALSSALVWVVAANLGFGPIGRIALEVAFHFSVGLIFFHSLARQLRQFVFPFVRAALADELLGFVQATKTDTSDVDFS